MRGVGALQAIDIVGNHPPPLAVTFAPVPTSRTFDRHQIEASPRARRLSCNFKHSRHAHERAPCREHLPRGARSRISEGSGAMMMQPAWDRAVVGGVFCLLAGLGIAIDPSRLALGSGLAPNPPLLVWPVNDGAHIRKERPNSKCGVHFFVPGTRKVSADRQCCIGVLPPCHTRWLGKTYVPRHAHADRHAHAHPCLDLCMRGGRNNVGSCACMQLRALFV